MSRRQRRALVVAVVWLALALGIWVTVAGRVSAVHGGELGAVVATGVLAGAAHARPRRRRR